MASSQGTRYPRGGSSEWQGDEAGPTLLRAEFFGAEAPTNIEASVAVTGPAPSITATAEVAGGGITASVAVTGPAPAIVATAASTVAASVTVTGPAPAITATAAASVAAQVAVSGPAPVIAFTALGGVAAEAAVEGPMPAIDAVAETVAAPPSEGFGWGGGINADREWFEREERERQEAARKAAEAAEQARQAEASLQPAAPRTDALLSIAPALPAPYVRRGPNPRAVFASLVAGLQELAQRQAIERAEAERIAAEAFAIEQERLAIEAALRQQALDDEAAEALMALLMHA